MPSAIWCSRLRAVARAPVRRSLKSDATPSPQAPRRGRSGRRASAASRTLSGSQDERGSKMPGESSTPLARRCSAKRGRMPVGTISTRSLPSSSRPRRSSVKISCMVTMSPSMPVISCRLIRRRRPSARRASWMTTWIAEAIWLRTARCGMSMPDIATMFSIRDSASRGELRVDGGQRAVVAGVHRLEHVERLGAADLAHDDAVGAHAQRVDHELALGDLAPALDAGRPRLEPADVLLLELELGRVLDRDDALGRADEAREHVQHRRLAGAGAARDQHVEPRADDRRAGTRRSPA